MGQEFMDVKIREFGGKSFKMKNKMLIFVLLGILLIGIVIAGEIGIINISGTSRLNSERQREMIKQGITSYQVKDYLLGNNITERCINGKNIIPTCKKINISGLTQEQINKKLNDWEDKRISEIADLTLNDNPKTLTREGIITFK